MRRISSLEGRWSATAQLRLLRLYARLTRPVGYRGMQRSTWMVEKLFDQRNAAWIGITASADIRVLLKDGYWTKLLDDRFEYEPEVGTALARLAPGADFLDCGANIGYWSVIAAERAAAVVAVEASHPVYEQLCTNLSATGTGTALNAAIWSESGQSVTIVSHQHFHANGWVTPERDETDTGYFSSSVQTMCIDDIVESHFPDPSRPIVIKLDVEGAEISAFDGARSTVEKRDVTFLYEDHGLDAEHTVTRHLLNLGMSVRDPVTDEPLTIDDVHRRKKNTAVGYNFLASPSRE